MRSNHLLVLPLLAGTNLVLACPAGEPDCDPADDAVYRELELYPDADGDGFASEDAELLCVGDSIPLGWLEAGGPVDCDDASAATFPGAPDIPEDEIDQDCDGEDAELVQSSQIYVDSGDPDCQDALPGTIEEPNCTLENASRLVEAGGTLRVAGGEYTFERVIGSRTYIGSHDPSDWSVDLEGHRTVIRQPDPDPDAIGFAAGAFIIAEDRSSPALTTVEGFEVIGSRVAGLSTGFWVQGRSPVHARNMVIRAGAHDFPSTEDEPSASVGVFVLMSDLTLEDSFIDAGGGRASCEGIRVFQGGEVTLRRVVIRGCEQAEESEGIQVGGTAILEDVDVGTSGVGLTAHGVNVLPGGRLFSVGSVIRAADSSLSSVGLRVEGDEARAEVKNSVFLGAPAGSLESRAVVVDDGGVLVAANSLFHGGVSTGERTTGVDVIEGRAVIVNSLIGGGRAEGGQDAAAVRSSSSADISLLASDLWDPEQNAAIGGSARVDNSEDLNDCEWIGCTLADGNMIADPEYEDWDGGSFRLRAESRCVDAGIDPTPHGLVVDRDIEGLPVPSDGNSDLMAVWDVGPHER